MVHNDSVVDELKIERSKIMKFLIKKHQPILLNQLMTKSAQY